MVDLGSLFWMLIPVLCALPVLLLAIGHDSRPVSKGLSLGLWLLLSGGWLLIWRLSRGASYHPQAGEAGLIVLILLLGLGLVPLLIVGIAHARAYRASSSGGET